MKRKFAQVGLDAIDASLVEATIYYEYFGKGGEHYHPLEVRQWKRTIRELRTIRRMIVEAGRAKVRVGKMMGWKGKKRYFFANYKNIETIARLIYRVRDVEGRSKP